MIGKISPGLKVVYYYITFECNLRCKHCYVGNKLASCNHADYDGIVSHLAKCFAQGARKVVFLGGEATLHPRYFDLLDTAAKIGFDQIIVDTNGVSQYPVPPGSWTHDRLTIRLGFEGPDSTTHDFIRGKNTFEKAIDTLRRVVRQQIRTEVTLTVNAMNVNQLTQAVVFFEHERVNELNFHFMSLVGNGKQNIELGLSADLILSAQKQLNILKSAHSIALRFPQLLVRRESRLSAEWKHNKQCRLFKPDVLLILPGGQMCRCPLQITADLDFRSIEPIPNMQDHCPYINYLLPNGIPEEYDATCISWKGN